MTPKTAPVKVENIFRPANPSRRRLPSLPALLPI